jgi:hypothetical protein
MAGLQEGIMAIIQMVLPVIQILDLVVIPAAIIQMSDNPEAREQLPVQAVPVVPWEEVVKIDPADAVRDGDPAAETEMINKVIISFRQPGNKTVRGHQEQIITPVPHGITLQQGNLILQEAELITVTETGVRRWITCYKEERISEENPGQIIQDKITVVSIIHGPIIKAESTIGRPEHDMLHRG